MAPESDFSSFDSRLHEHRRNFILIRALLLSISSFTYAWRILHNSDQKLRLIISLVMSSLILSILVIICLRRTMYNGKHRERKKRPVRTASSYGCRYVQRLNISVCGWIGDAWTNLGVHDDMHDDFWWYLLSSFKFSFFLKIWRSSMHFRPTFLCSATSSSSCSEQK